MMETVRETIALLSYFIIPLMLAAFPLYGLYKRVPVYEAFVDGAKEGFHVAVRIIPYLVAILFAVGMFRASGAMEAMTNALRPLLAVIGFLTGRPEFLDLAIVYGLLNVIGTIAILKFFRYRDLGRPAPEREALR